MSVKDFLGNAKKNLGKARRTGHGSNSEANHGWVDNKPYSGYWSNGVFEGYDESLWKYWSMPLDVKTNWAQDPQEILESQDFFNEITRELGKMLDNQTERTRNDMRRKFHIVMSMDLYSGIPVYPGCTPAHRSYLERASNEITKGQWFGYMGLQLNPSSLLYDTHSLRSKVAKYLEFMTDNDAMQYELYREDFEIVNNIMDRARFRPLDFLGEDPITRLPGQRDFEQLTAWYGISDLRYNMERNLETTRFSEFVHGKSVLLPKSWDPNSERATEVTFSAIRPKVDAGMFMSDPQSNFAQFMTKPLRPNANVVSISIRGEIRSGRVADNMLEQKVESRNRKNNKNRGKRVDQPYDVKTLGDINKIDTARNLVGGSNGAPMLDNVEIVVGQIVTDGENKLNGLLREHGLEAVTLVNRQAEAILNTLPTWPNQIHRIRAGNATRSIMTNQMLPGVLGFSGLFRSTRPAEPYGIFLGHDDSNTEFREIYTSVEAAKKNNNVPGFLVTGRPGSGKALPLDEPIPTPNGWTTMGNLAVGDEVYGSDGLTYPVSFKTRVMENHDVYSIKMVRNGDLKKIRADAEHQWIVAIDRQETVEVLNRWRSVAATALRDAAKAYANDSSRMSVGALKSAVVGVLDDALDSSLERLDFYPEEIPDLLSFMEVQSTDGQGNFYPARRSFLELADRIEGNRVINVNGVKSHRLLTTEIRNRLRHGIKVLIPSALDPISRKPVGDHSIVSVDAIDSVPVQCITVESPNHSYIVGDGVVTSNTQTMLQIVEQAHYQGYSVFFMNPKKEATLQPVFDHLGGATVSMSDRFLMDNPGCLDPVFFMDALVPNDGATNVRKRKLEMRIKVANIISDAIFTGLKWKYNRENMAEMQARMAGIRAQINANAANFGNTCSSHIIFGNSSTGTLPVEDKDVIEYVRQNIQHSAFWKAFIADTGDAGSVLQKQMMQNRAVLMEWDGSLRLPGPSDVPADYGAEQIESLLSVQLAFIYASNILGEGRSGGVLAADESWVFKSSEEIKSILNAGFREWRQLNIMMLMGTQNISDWMGRGGIDSGDMSSFFSRILIMAINEQSDHELELFFKLSKLPDNPYYRNYIINAGVDPARKQIVPHGYYIDNITKYRGPMIMGPYPSLELGLGRTDAEGEAIRKAMDSGVAGLQEQHGAVVKGALADIVDIHEKLSSEGYDASTEGLFGRREENLYKENPDEIPAGSIPEPIRQTQGDGFDAL